MLTEKRQEEILRLLTLKGSVTVQELKEYFDASESTIRRDLNFCNKCGFTRAGACRKGIPCHYPWW